MIRRSNGFDKFVAEYYLNKNKGLIDMDKAFVLANDLWDRATHKDKSAERLLGNLATIYNHKRELA